MSERAVTKVKNHFTTDLSLKPVISSIVLLNYLRKDVVTSKTMPTFKIHISAGFAPEREGWWDLYKSVGKKRTDFLPVPAIIIRKSNIVFDFEDLIKKNSISETSSHVIF